MKHIIIILCLVSFSAFANPLDDLRAQLLETFKDVEITNKAFQVCENWAVQQVDAAATAKVAAKTAELEQAKTDAATAAATKEAERVAAQAVKLAELEKAKDQAAPAIVELEKELAIQQATGPGPKSDVLVAVKAKIATSTANAKRAALVAQKAAIQKQIDDLR